MKELTESIWNYFIQPGHVICLTTNGTIKKNGEGVMGRGNAKQAVQLMPGIEKALGKYLKLNGNQAGYLSSDELIIVFPVKNNWWDEQADLYLIQRSARWLEAMANLQRSIIFHLPRPGCGNGRRDWEKEVKPILTRIYMPDNVWIHDLPAGEKL